MASGIVHVPFYATGLRHDELAIALTQIAPISINYGAANYEVFRQREDRYKFLFVVEMPSHDAWDAYWYGPEFSEMRATMSTAYQVPLLYYWQDRIVVGAAAEEPVAAGDGRR